MHRAVVLFTFVCVAVRADATGRDAPCGGCTLDVSTTATDPVPLVVLLHGDTDSARERADKWRAAVARRGWALLSLQCPARLGCPRGSWYRWRHEPGWVREQVRDIVGREPIDTSRIYLVGWSGGATFVGKHLQAWPRTFAAAVIHGGGVAPRSKECPDRAFPAYFLVGDMNPGHGGAKRLRAYFEDCGQEIEWDLLPGANHTQEDAALTPEKAEAILHWLASRHRTAARS